MLAKAFVNKTDSGYIPAAFFAMMSPGRFHSFTFLTPSLPLAQNHILAIILIITQSSLPQPSPWSRINSASLVIAPPYSQNEAVEP
jgi:hypothetical protein